MREALSMLGAGLILGSLYFGGLWVTVHLAVRRRAPAILRLSQAARLAGLGAVLILIGATAPPALIPALAGLLIARLALMAMVRRAPHAA
jgi:F1F0 ATPase subunit 2